MRPSDHVGHDQLAAEPLDRGLAGFDRRLHGGDVAAHHDRDVRRADFFLAGQRHIRRLEHVVGRVQRGHQTLSFQQTNRFSIHRNALLLNFVTRRQFARASFRLLQYEFRNTAVSLTTLYPGYTATEFAAVSNAQVPWIVQATQTQARFVAAAGINALLKGKKMAIPGAFNKLSAFFTRVLPRGIVVFFTGKLMGG